MVIIGRLGHFAGLLAFAVGLIACNETIRKLPEDDGDMLPPSQFKPTELNYANVYDQVLRQSCVGCHGTSGGIRLETYEQTKTHAQEIYDSVFIQRSMPKAPTPPLSARQRGLLSAWIKAGLPESSLVEPLPTPGPVLGPTFASIRHHILETKCLVCHAPGKSVGRIPLVTKEDILNSPLELAIPGNPDESGLVLAVIEENPRKIMPPPKDAQGNPTGFTKLSDPEIKAIYDWILNGAKD